jgi:Type IV conjugative transfer system lipoprotein (TraV)
MKWSYVLVLSIVLSGCAVKYGCPAPEGVQCKPISEVYRSLSHTEGAKKIPKESLTNSKAADLAPASETPVPIRSAPKILRVWVAPWIDQEGDLHQEGYLYLVVDHGTWALGLPAVESEPVPKLGMTPENQSGDHSLEMQVPSPMRSDADGRK